jgi:hypothetical protein
MVQQAVAEQGGERFGAVTRVAKRLGIGPESLRCLATIGRVFANREPDWILPRLLAALHDAGPSGLDGTAQRDLFDRHLGVTAWLLLAPSWRRAALSRRPSRRPAATSDNPPHTLLE